MTSLDAEVKTARCGTCVVFARLSYSATDTQPSLCREKKGDLFHQIALPACADSTALTEGVRPSAAGEACRAGGGGRAGDIRPSYGATRNAPDLRRCADEGARCDGQLRRLLYG